jgi:hypothetical protein
MWGVLQRKATFTVRSPSLGFQQKQTHLLAVAMYCESGENLTSVILEPLCGTER